MAILISRKYLLVIFLSSMYQHSTGQCPAGNLMNVVLREGNVHKFSLPTGGKFNLGVIPSNDFFIGVKRVADSKNGITPAFKESILADQSGLTIVNVSTSPAKNKTWCTAGLYIMENLDAKCNATAKVAVIKSGPICQCNASTKTTPANYSCIMYYADSPVSAMNPQYTWYSANGKENATDDPTPRKCDRLVYRSVSVYPFKSTGKGKDKDKVVPTLIPKTCTVTFKVPNHGPFPSMAKNVPTFTDSCSFDKCV